MTAVAAPSLVRAFTANQWEPICIGCLGTVVYALTGPGAAVVVEEVPADTPCARCSRLLGTPMCTAATGRTTHCGWHTDYCGAEAVTVTVRPNCPPELRCRACADVDLQAGYGHREITL